MLEEAGRWRVVSTEQYYTPLQHSPLQQSQAHSTRKSVTTEFMFVCVYVRA